MPEALQAEHRAVREEVFYRVVFQGYLERERKQVEKLRHIDRVRVPDGFDYSAVRGLRAESAQKLAQVAPSTLGQASRISGVNPADISVLMVHLEARTKRREG
jgi:NAD/FAD-utilizing enzyme apparently involved in cell division